ncbi:MAG: BolA family protein [Pseudomonadota bacterium]|nr:BolA family protein [Pseudomonadota bacterium]
MERVEKIKNILVQDFEPTKLEIFDESHLHAGHEGAKSGKGHFRVAIQSMKFVGQSEIKRHKMVYRALENLFKTDIHALSLETKTPE